MWATRAQYLLWTLLDDPSSSRFAKWLSSIIMMIIGLSVISFTLESLPADCVVRDEWIELIGEDGETIRTRSTSPKYLCKDHEPDRSPFFEIETFCIMVFSVEFVLRLLSCPAGPGILRFIVAPMNIIDLAAILPWYIGKAYPGGGDSAKGLAVLRVLRLTRVLRIFKMSRNFQGLLLLIKTFQKSATALLMLCFFVAICLILFATLVFESEKGAWDEYRMQWIRADGTQSPFESIPESMWWTIITMCTVGYGDVWPITFAGQLVAIAAMFVGLLVLSLPITIIGANFDELYRQQRTKDEEAKAKRKREAQAERASRIAAGGPADLPQGFMASLLAGRARVDLGNDDLASHPLRRIQKLIAETHERLVKDCQALMDAQERELRSEITAALSILEAYSPCRARRAGRHIPPAYAALAPCRAPAQSGAEVGVAHRQSCGHGQQFSAKRGTLCAMGFSTLLPPACASGRWPDDPIGGDRVLCDPVFCVRADRDRDSDRERERERERERPLAHGQWPPSI